MAKLHVKAAVIGAGMSGLVAARELRREGHRVVVFESSNDVGGMWLYDPRVESDPLRLDPGRDVVHSSLYQSLRVNLPRQLMGFSDYPFLKKGCRDPRSFPGHEEVLRFLRGFAEDFGLIELIRFGHKVVRVAQAVEGRRDQWAVEWHTRGGEAAAGVDVFEAVVVCNGRNTQPKIAEFPGRSAWPGEQLHSHNYRIPEPYKDKIACAEEDGKIVFQDRSFIHTDVIIHCTGYSYHFPFLKTKGVVSVDNNRVGPLYKHVFPPSLAPWLSFIDIPYPTFPAQLGELQSKWVSKVLSGEMVLPSEEEMMSSVEAHYQRIEELGWPKHHTHRLKMEKFEYENWLAAQLGLPPLEQWREKMAFTGLKLLQSSDQNWRDTWDIEKWMQEEGFGNQIPGLDLDHQSEHLEPQERELLESLKESD